MPEKLTLRVNKHDDDTVEIYDEEGSCFYCGTDIDMILFSLDNSRDIIERLRTGEEVKVRLIEAKE